MALRYLSTAEAGKAIGISAQAVRRYIEAGHLPAVNIAASGRKRFRISEDALRDFMDKRPSHTDGAA
jgi:excisionase family DNA binding protein